MYKKIQDRRWNTEQPSVALDSWKLWKRFFDVEKKGNNWKWCNLKLNWNRKSISIIERVIYRDMCRVICITFQRSLPLYIEIYRMGKNKRTVNTSTTPHISDQSGTEKACKTLLCWFIIMIEVPVCNSMYRYEHHFWSFYHYPAI